MGVMREVLPNTMAAVRISGMELSVLGCHYHFKDCIAKSVSGYCSLGFFMHTW
ncbi:unnamed protein product [Prunus brigantina]